MSRNRANDPPGTPDAAARRRRSRPEPREGTEPFWFTARRWTNEQLDAAEHLPDLVARETVRVNLDHAMQGIGSQSCGPGMLPQYRLDAAAAQFSFVFSTVE